MKKLLFIFTLLISIHLVAREPEELLQNSQDEQRYRVTNKDLVFELPHFVFDYTNTRVTVKFINPKHSALVSNNNELSFMVNGVAQNIKFDASGVGYFYYTFKHKNNFQILFEDVNYTLQASVISIWYIISPLFALLLFFAYKIVMPAKNKGIKLTIAHNEIKKNNADQGIYASTLRVVSVKEKEEVF